MPRTFVGVIVGFLIMAVVLIAGLSAAYMGMGAEGAFAPDTYEVSTKSVLITFGVVFLAAILGGYTCAAISRSCKAPLVLAGVVLVVVILFVTIPVAMTSGQEVPMARDPDVDSFKAIWEARTSAWIALLIPLVGAAGVLGGGRLRGNRKVVVSS
jgi:Mn2+/Fe2+ NRAMP family transporter